MVCRSLRSPRRLSTPFHKYDHVCGEGFLAQTRRERRAYPSGVCKERATTSGPKRTAARRVAPHLASGFVAPRSQSADIGPGTDGKVHSTGDGQKPGAFHTQSHLLTAGILSRAQAVFFTEPPSTAYGKGARQTLPTQTQQPLRSGPPSTTRRNRPDGFSIVPNPRPRRTPRRQPTAHGRGPSEWSPWAMAIPRPGQCFSTRRRSSRDSARRPAISPFPSRT